MMMELQGFKVITKGKKGDQAGKEKSNKQKSI